MSTMTKGFGLIPIIIILALLAGGGYYFVKNKVDTPDISDMSEVGAGRVVKEPSLVVGVSLGGLAAKLVVAR